jgi:hypothetical protein
VVALVLAEALLFAIYLLYRRFGRRTPGVYLGWDPLGMFMEWSFPLTRAQIINIIFILGVFVCGFLFALRYFRENR